MASQPQEAETLQGLLAKALPKDVGFIFYHISTPPRRCTSIFAPAPTQKPERTYCESHFLSVSVRPQDAQKTDEEQELMVMAIEINLYSTKSLTTLFVAKADSTGFLSLLNLPKTRTRTSPLKAIASTLVDYLVRSRQREGKRFVVSLFARAQNQYLFPLSSDVATKHVLDDRQLVRWWCRVLDPILNIYAPEKEDLTIQELETGAYDDSATTAKGYLLIPGVDRYETRRFFPQTMASSSPRWVHGHPLLQISPLPTAPPRCLVPRFPDDPKARYLDELDDEITGVNIANNVTPSRSNGLWRSVKSLEQFWEMMAFRQECSSGRLVGFIWVVLTPPDLDEPEDYDLPESQTSLFSMAETLPACVGRRASPPERKKRKKPLSGPIIARLPRIKSAGSSSSSLSSQPATTPYYLWPEKSRGELVLSQKDYDRAHELLLHQNFGSKASAANSTQMWVKEVGILAGKNGGWGWTIIGQNGDMLPANSTNTSIKTESSASEAEGANRIQILDTSTLRKKRKPDFGEPGLPIANGISEANLLTAGLVRKKPRVDEPSREDQLKIGEVDDQPTVNVLSARLVRKKSKQLDASVVSSTGREAVNVLNSDLVRKKSKS